MRKKSVYVTRQIPREGIDFLTPEFDVEVNPEDRALTREEFLTSIRGKDGVICLVTETIDAEVFEAAPEVKGFANFAVGYNNLDVQEATRRGIPVSNTPDVLTKATAEMAWALLFAAARRVVESDAVARSGRWPGWGPLQFIGGDVSGRTLGIVGAGRIGAAMALMSRGFDMPVLYWDTRKNTALEETLGARKVSFEELLAGSDFISIHVPLLPETTGLFGLEEFGKMKRTAYLINTSRGPVVKEKELAEALKKGLIAGAGIDVYEREPDIEPDLRGLTNVVLTPHTASATGSARKGMALKAAENIRAMLRGERPPDCLNPEVLKY
ncbi:MAG: D-glycerate dehydrogenase [Spirochaetales bacterium]|nr:D-glycerate dehydrogenase [Spirochaetales bacterium]